MPIRMRKYCHNYNFGRKGYLNPQDLKYNVNLSKMERNLRSFIVENKSNILSVPWFLPCGSVLAQFLICWHWWLFLTVVFKSSGSLIISDLFRSAAAAAAAFRCLLRLFLCWWLPGNELGMACEFNGWLVPPCPNRRPFPEIWLLLE